FSICHVVSTICRIQRVELAFVTAVLDQIVASQRFQINLGVDGLKNMATLVMPVAISLSSSGHLPAMVGSILVKPVTLPPGRAKLVTKRLPSGSATIAKMM